MLFIPINLIFKVFLFLNLNLLIINELINLSNQLINMLQLMVILVEYLMVKQLICLYML